MSEKSSLPSSSSSNNNDTSTWKDITSVISQAASSLTYTTPMLHIPNFNLYDSMAALELMDPKMDCCEIPTNYYSSSFLPQVNVSAIPPRRAPTCIQDEVTPLPFYSGTRKVNKTEDTSDKDHCNNTDNPPMSLQECCIIVLEMISRLYSYMDGVSAAESIYTCLYAHDCIVNEMYQYLIHSDNDAQTQNVEMIQIQAIQWTILASSVLMIKISSRIKDIIQNADIYEEEDFCTNSYTFTFLKDFDFHRTTNIEKNSDNDKAQHHHQQLEMENSTSSSPLDRKSNLPLSWWETIINLGDVAKMKLSLLNDVTKGEDEKLFVEILNLLLEFLIDFFRTCVSLSNLTKDVVQTRVQDTQERIRKGLDRMDHLIKLLEDSTVANTIKISCANSKNTILHQTFDLNVNRHLLGNIPTRKVTFSDPFNTIKSLRRIFHQLEYAVCDIILCGNSYTNIHRKLSELSRSKNVSILTRSLLVLNLYFDELIFGQYELSNVIRLNMIRYGVLESILQSEYGILFINRLGKAMYDTLKLLLLNRNRQRGFMEHVMFHDWQTLQTEAATLERIYQMERMAQQEAETGGAEQPYSHKPCVSNYVLFFIVRLMEHYLSLGVELDLFTSHSTISMIFWYRDFLFSLQLNIMTSIKESIAEKRIISQRTKDDLDSKNQSDSSSKKKNKKITGKKKHLESVSSNGQCVDGEKNDLITEDMDDDIEFLLVGMKRTLCRGTVRFIASLNQNQLLSIPTYQFTSHELIFQKLFEPFRLFYQPLPLSIEDYRSGSDFSNISSVNLRSSTAECFTASKNVIDKILVLLEERSKLKDIDNLSSSTTSEGSTVLTGGIIQKDEVLQLKKVSIGNSLFLQKLSQVLSSNDSSKCSVAFDFGVHDQFCTIKINNTK